MKRKMNQHRLFGGQFTVEESTDIQWGGSNHMTFSDEVLGLVTEEHTIIE